MKIFRVHFVAEEDLLLLGNIPDIINESKVIGLNLEFQGGGWDKDDQFCYHEWIGSGEGEMARKFFINQYGESFCEVIMKELNEEQGTNEANETSEANGTDQSDEANRKNRNEGSSGTNQPDGRDGSKGSNGTTGNNQTGKK